MKKVLFRTGRGGRFNNAGHVTAEGVIGEFNPEYFGINIYFNDNEENPEIRLDNGEVVCNLNDLDSDNGSFNIDNDYNSYHWVAFKDLDENDLKIMIRDLSEHEYRYELIESGVDIDVFNYLSEKDILNTDDGIYHLDNQTTWKDFKDAN